MKNSYQADFVAIAMSICDSNLTRFYAMDGWGDIDAAENVMQPIRSYSTKWRNITPILEMSTALKPPQNDCILITAMIRTTSEHGHANRAIWFDADHGANEITQIK